MRPFPAGGIRTSVKALARSPGAILLALFCAGCSATTRYKVLTFFFDGVPPPRAAGTAPMQQPGAPAAVPARPVGLFEHSPYAARRCDACHDAAATNSLVAPREQLCFRCHELRLDKKYVHGPIASGGCLVCHDPHSSRFAHLLVSDSDSFCFHCHEARTVRRIEGHEGLQGGCTSCHDAHSSDEQYLLK